MDKSAFTLVFVALLAATAGSAVTYAIMKRPPAEPGALVATVEPRPARPPAPEGPTPVVNEPASSPMPSDAPFAVAAPGGAAPDAVGKIRKNPLRSAAAGGLLAPEEFERTFFSAANGPATPDELARAATALTEEIAGTEGYLQANRETQPKLAALRQSAKALANKAENKPEVAARIRARFDSDLADLARSTQGQVQELAAVIQRRATP